MTWSIIAHDRSTGWFGVAVATRFFAVGARVPYVAAGVGAIATPAMVNPYYGIDGVKLLRIGLEPQSIIDALTARDPCREHRQLHVMDASGKIAQHTGRDCIGWCGSVRGDNFSIAGNMLAGARVLDETAAAFRANSALPLPRRLIAALMAGEAAGGDKRGKQSAAVVTWTTEEYPAVSLRVDDHEDPIAELRRLESVGRERLFHYTKLMPTRQNPYGITDRNVIEAAIAAGVAAQEEER